MTFDVNDLPLPHAPSGHFKDAEIATNGMRISLVKIAGRWHGLNYRSCDPLMMRNRAERSTWAKFIGVPAKDVEAYVRRKKRERAKEQLAADVEHAKRVLRAAGYEVTD
jgi:hypothetical protein